MTRTITMGGVTAEEVRQEVQELREELEAKG